MRVIMTGGGTGGHVNPALAIAETIKRNEPDSEIIFVGTERGIENKLVPAAGYELHHVDVRGIRRSLSLANIRAFWLAMTSPYKAKRLIREFEPDVVIGTGGYVSWPVVKAASMMGVPCALHESNAIAGVAVKMLQDKADRIYLNFEATGRTLHCPEKLLRVGNPLAGDFARMSREEARAALGIEGKYKNVLLSYGGSMGAEKVNESVLALMKDYSSKHPETLHIHATGSIEWDIARNQFNKMGLDKFENLQLVEYIYDMPVKMAAADLIICRAGALTISELAISGKCPIFIPSPNVTENHQYKNAKVLADAGAAFVFEERELASNAKLLAETVKGLLSEDGEKERALMSERIREFAVPDANRLIYNDIKKLVNEKKTKR